MSYLQTNWHLKTDKVVNLRVQDVAKGQWYCPDWWGNVQGKRVKEEQRRYRQKGIKKVLVTCKTKLVSMFA